MNNLVSEHRFSPFNKWGEDSDNKLNNTCLHVLQTIIIICIKGMTVKFLGIYILN